MAKHRRPKKLTKAEAGRLGGKSTVRKYGPEHMRRIGKAGFAALRKKFGWNADPCRGAGRGAIQWLQRQGKFPRPSAEEQAKLDAMCEELWEQLRPKDLDQEDPQP
jgi:hypothetical protein